MTNVPHHVKTFSDGADNLEEEGMNRERNVWEQKDHFSTSVRGKTDNAMKMG